MEANNLNNVYSLDNIDKIFINNNLKNKNLNILSIVKKENNKIFATKDELKNYIVDDGLKTYKKNLEQEFLDTWSENEDDDDLDLEEEISLEEENLDEDEDFEDDLILKNQIYSNDEYELEVDENFAKEDFNSNLNYSKEKNLNCEKTKGTLNSKNDLENYKLLGNEGMIELKFDNLDCLICLNTFKTKELIMEVNECEHYFHFKCLTKWIIIKGNQFCPICK